MLRTAEKCWLWSSREMSLWFQTASRVEERERGSVSVPCVRVCVSVVESMKPPKRKVKEEKSFSPWQWQWQRQWRLRHRRRGVTRYVEPFGACCALEWPCCCCCCCCMCVFFFSSFFLVAMRCCNSFSSTLLQPSQELFFFCFCFFFWRELCWPPSSCLPFLIQPAHQQLFPSSSFSSSLLFHWCSSSSSSSPNGAVNGPTFPVYA